MLLRQGDITHKLFFLAEGNLQVVYIGKEKRSIKHLNIEQKPANFMMDSRPMSKQKQKPRNYSIHETFYFPTSENQNNKEFLYGSKKVNGEELEYNDHVLFAELRTGDFFGGKSFLSVEQREKKAMSSPLFDARLPAKLTVVSSSIQTTVYSLDEKKFFSLSDNLQKVISDGLMKTPYFDEKDIDSKINEQKEWKKYSENLVAKIIKQKKSRNNSFRI